MRYIFLIFFTLFGFIYAQDSFNLNLSKDSAYLNEPIVAKFTLKYPSNKKIRYIKFNRVDEDGFITKFIKDIKTKDKNITTIDYYYLIIPQKIVNFYSKKEIKIARFDPKSSLIFWNSLYTQKKSLNIHPLPSKKSYITGDLELNSTFKKVSKGVYSLTLQLKGLANFLDIEPFKLNIQGNPTIYTNKPTIKYEVIDDKVVGKFTQKFTILSNNSFKIDSILFTYFNTKSHMLEYLKSKDITVNSFTFSLQNFYYLLIGFLSGILITILIIKAKLFKIYIPIKQKIVYAPTKKILYKTLLPLIDRYDLDDIIKELEESIYNNKKFTISKKEIIKRLTI